MTDIIFSCRVAGNGEKGSPAVLVGTVSKSDSFSCLGWIVGAGVEYAVTNNLAVKAEYNYLDFGTQLAVQLTMKFPTCKITVEARRKSHRA
jgi:opacity protein-like surface antigen